MKSAVKTQIVRVYGKALAKTSNRSPATPNVNGASINEIPTYANSPAGSNGSGKIPPLGNAEMMSKKVICAIRKAGM